MVPVGVICHVGERIPKYIRATFGEFARRLRAVCMVLGVLIFSIILKTWCGGR